MINLEFMIIGSIVLCIYLVIRSSIWRRASNLSWTRELILVVLVMYITFMAYITVFPSYILFIGYDISTIWHSINIIPIKSIIFNIKQIGVAYDGDSLFMLSLILKNVGGNIILLLPLGILAPLLWQKFASIKSTFFIGVSVSLGIELIQLLELMGGLAIRVVDVDDVLCNVVGAIIGYYIFILIIRLEEKWPIKLVERVRLTRMIGK